MRIIRVSVYPSCRFSSSPYCRPCFNRLTRFPSFCPSAAIDRLRSKRAYGILRTLDSRPALVGSLTGSYAVIWTAETTNEISQAALRRVCARSCQDKKPIPFKLDRCYWIQKNDLFLFERQDRRQSTFDFSEVLKCVRTDQLQLDARHIHFLEGRFVIKTPELIPRQSTPSVHSS